MDDISKVIENAGNIKAMENQINSDMCELIYNEFIDEQSLLNSDELSVICNGYFN